MFHTYLQCLNLFNANYTVYILYFVKEFPFQNIIAHFIINFFIKIISIDWFKEIWSNHNID